MQLLALLQNFKINSEIFLCVCSRWRGWHLGSCHQGKRGEPVTILRSNTTNHFFSNCNHVRPQVTKGPDHNKTGAQGSCISLGPGSTGWTCPILNMGECLLITRENGCAQAWQGLLQISIGDLHEKWAQTGATGRDVHRWSTTIRNSQVKSNMCNNKSHLKSLNTLQKYGTTVPFLAWEVVNFLGEMTEANQRWPALKSKLMSRRQDPPVDLVRRQVWQKNCETLIIPYPQNAGHMTKSIFKQQAGVFWLAED